MTAYYDRGGGEKRGEGINYFSSGSNTDIGTVLNSAQVYGTSGGGLAFRIPATQDSAIKKFYCFCNAITGTAGNLAVQAELRNERTSGTNFQQWPGTTVRQSAVTGTWATKGAKHWVEFDFSGGSLYTPTRGEILWVSVSNTAGAPATDYPQFISTTGTILGGSPFLPATQHTTTNGYTTAGTPNNTQGAVCVIEYDNGVIDGNPFTRNIATFFTSNQLERGAVWDGWDVPIWCYGVSWNGASNAWTNLNFYSGNTAPGGTAYQAFTLGSTTGQIGDRSIGVKLFTPFLLLPGTKYRVVLKANANVQLPNVMNIEAATEFTDLTLAGLSNGTLGYSTIDNGAGGWTDDKAAWPAMKLLTQSYVPGSASRGIYTGSRL